MFLGIKYFKQVKKKYKNNNINPKEIFKNYNQKNVSIKYRRELYYIINLLIYYSKLRRFLAHQPNVTINIPRSSHNYWAVFNIYYNILNQHFFIHPLIPMYCYKGLFFIRKPYHTTYCIGTYIFQYNIPTLLFSFLKKKKKYTIIIGGIDGSFPHTHMHITSVNL